MEPAVIAFTAVAALAAGIPIGWGLCMRFAPCDTAKHYREHFEDGFAKGWLRRDLAGHHYRGEPRTPIPTKRR